MEEFKKFIIDYGPYLEDLRKRVIDITICFILFFLVGFFSAGYLLQFFIKFFSFNNVSITTTSPFQFIGLAVDTGLSIAVILILPLILGHFYAFVRPGLEKHEKLSFLKSIPVTMILFLSGFFYGGFVLYFGLGAIANLNESIGLKNFWDISLFLSQLFLTASLLGVLFEFPVIITGLIRWQFFDLETLSSKRRIAIAVIFIIVSLLPPTDGLSLVIMAVPMVGLYEITILYNRYWQRFNKRSGLINNFSSL